jgi:hypothetical protein
MLIAVKYLGNVGVGVTSPQLFRADDKKVYVVKLQNNRVSSKVLANEFLAAKFGEIMDLCFPASDIINITEKTVQENRQLLELGVISGRHFASRFLNRAKYVGKNNLDKAVNIVEMAGVILFDHLFHNSDRNSNRKNLLLRQEAAGYKIYAIDNSHLFESGSWTLGSLNSLRSKINIYYRDCYGLLLRKCLSPQDFLPYLEKITQLTDEHIVNLVQEIPNEWLPEKSERQELIHYIKLRRDMVDKIREKLCNHIPEARGGHQWWH